MRHRKAACFEASVLEFHVGQKLRPLLATLLSSLLAKSAKFTASTIFRKMLWSWATMYGNVEMHMWVALCAALLLQVMQHLSTLGILQVSPCNDMKAERMRLCSLESTEYHYDWTYVWPFSISRWTDGDCMWRQWVCLVFSMHVSCLPCANWNVNALNVLEEFFISAWDSQ